MTKSGLEPVPDGCKWYDEFPEFIRKPLEALGDKLRFGPVHHLNSEQVVEILESTPDEDGEGES